MKTTKITKVLIALDYDPTAQKIAESGYALAKNLGAEIVLLHVISDPIYYLSADYSPIMGFNGYMETGPLVLNTEGALKRASLDFLNKTKQHLGDESIQTVVEEGEFSESILQTAKKVHANLIVMGTHSRKWLENIVMGSVAENVLQKSTIPMFIIPTKKKP